MKDKYGNNLSTKETVLKIKNRMENIFLEFEIFLLHLVGIIPSHIFRRFVYRLFGMKIGKGSVIHMGLRIYDPRNIEIGEDTIIGEGAVLDGRAKLVIGNHVDMASEVMIYNSEHDIHSEDFQAIHDKVVIEDYVFVGPRAIIQAGLTIGKGAIVAAGAVVTKDVEALSVVGGVPAKKITDRKVKELKYKLGRARWFR